LTAWRTRRTARSMCARTSAYNVAYSTTCDRHRWCAPLRADDLATTDSLHCEYKGNQRHGMHEPMLYAEAAPAADYGQQSPTQQQRMRWPPRRSPRCRSGMAWHGMADCVDSFHTALLSALSATSTSSRRTSALDLTALCCSAPTLRGQRQIFAAQTGATPHSTRGAHRTYGADISVLSDFTSTVPFEQGPAVVYQDSPYSSAASFQLVV
jgi:hypothetical protein